MAVILVNPSCPTINELRQMREASRAKLWLVAPPEALETAIQHDASIAKS